MSGSSGCSRPRRTNAAGYFLDWQSQLEELEAGRQQEVKLKEEYVDKKRQAVNLEMYRQQAREIESSFGVLLKQLPNRSQMEALLVDINQSGLGRGLQFDLFKPAQSETVKDFYAELPISLKVQGTYHDMGAFASDIAQLSRIVTLNDIALAINKDGSRATEHVLTRPFLDLVEHRIEHELAEPVLQRDPRDRPGRTRRDDDIAASPAYRNGKVASREGALTQRNLGRGGALDVVCHGSGRQ